MKKPQQHQLKDMEGYEITGLKEARTPSQQKKAILAHIHWWKLHAINVRNSIETIQKELGLF